MADYQIPTGSSVDRSSTLGQQFLRNVMARMPYYGGNKVLDNVEMLNPAYKHFYKTGTDRDEKIQKKSVSVPYSGQDVATIVNTLSERGYNDVLYASIDRDKGKRIREYRIMAAFAELANALDEICDEFVVKDEEGDVVKLELPNEIDDEVKKQLRTEFRKFINYYDLEHKGWEYVRSVLTDAEVFFENVIHKDKPELGILGVISMPPELINPIYDNVQNLLIKGFLLKKPIIDPKTQKVVEEQLIPLEKKQVTYINSGIWNEDKTLKLPFIENARRAYKQLSMIEDSIVIYRLVRAPERLVFKVDVGNMPTDKAEQYLQGLMQKYWSKKTYDNDRGTTANIYNPQSMLDSYWFAKRPNSEGTTVDVLPGGQNLGQLEDLIYFQKKLYKALKVPANRLNPDTPFADGAEITREELKFARFIIRIQEQFAIGLKEAFITHLKLRSWWEDFELKETDILLKFNEPSSFNTLRNQQIFEMRANNYNTMSENPLISNTYAQKKWLGMTDDDVKINREWLRKDAAFKWELAQIEQGGPNWRAAAAAGGAEGEGAAGGGGGGGMPPAFGPGPKTNAPNNAPAGPEEGGEAGDQNAQQGGNAQQEEQTPVQSTSNQRSKLP
jgi:hypothetical protein